MVEGSHRSNLSLIAAAKAEVMIDWRYEVDPKYMITGQFVMVDEGSVMDVLLKLSHKRPIHSLVYRSSHLRVPYSEAMLHKDAEYLRNAEIREVEKVSRFAGAHGIEDDPDTLSCALGGQ